MRIREKRTLRFLEIKLSHGHGALHKQPWDLESISRTMIGQGFYSRNPRVDAKRVARIRHGKIFEHKNEKFLGLLLVHADSRLIEASYEHLHKGSARTLPMEDGEGMRTEAHVVVRLKPAMLGTTQCYPMALEESPSLSPSVLLSRLHHPIHQAGKREAKDSSGNTVSWYPVVNVDGLLSKSLLDEIAAGQLSELELIRQAIVSEGLDEPGELVPRLESLNFYVKPGADASMIQRVISAGRRFGFDQKYEQLRIRYRESGSSKTKTAVIDIDEDAVDPASELDKLVSRSETVSLKTPMNWDHEEVVDDFLELMAERLMAESDSEQES